MSRPVIDARQIMDLPINGRRVDTFVLLTPGVTNDGTFGLLSFRGVAGGNAFLMDGNDTTEQYYNENAGRTRIASQISQDAVQEFQVVSANFSAEYGRAMGGVVNTVTKSGSNDLHGTAYWFFRNRTLNARDRYATFNPPELRHQAGASLGGAIVKDKLFYFLNVDITRRNFPMVSSLNFPTRGGPEHPYLRGLRRAGDPGAMRRHQQHPAALLRTDPAHSGQRTLFRQARLSSQHAEQLQREPELHAVPVAQRDSERCRLHHRLRDRHQWQRFCPCPERQPRLDLRSRNPIL